MSHLEGLHQHEIAQRHPGATKVFQGVVVEKHPQLFPTAGGAGASIPLFPDANTSAAIASFSTNFKAFLEAPPFSLSPTNAAIGVALFTSVFTTFSNQDNILRAAIVNSTSS